MLVPYLLQPDAQVNTGLRTSPAPASEAPRTFYGAINPRVITTGCPAKRAAGRQLPYRRPPATRASSSALPDELPASPTAADAEAAPARAVLEVRLVRPSASWHRMSGMTPYLFAIHQFAAVRSALFHVRTWLCLHPRHEEWDSETTADC